MATSSASVFEPDANTFMHQTSLHIMSRDDASALSTLAACKIAVLQFGERTHAVDDYFYEQLDHQLHEHYGRARGSLNAIGIKVAESKHVLVRLKYDVRDGREHDGRKLGQH